MKYLILTLNLIFAVRVYSSSLYDKPVPEVIESYGYPSETHSIFTEDGFNLILHRIPCGRNCEESTRTPIYLNHGFFLSSLSWLLLGPDRSLGFLLADNGYDVWMANSRGNCYSRRHKYFDRNVFGKYWDFSFHEMGVYDTSTAVDYIVNVTSRTDILYIGLSQSSSAGLVHAIRYPNSNIKAYFLMAPISYLTKSISPLRALIPVEPLITLLTRGDFEFSLNFQPLKSIEKILCDIVPEVCFAPFAVCGYDLIHQNRTASSVLLPQSCGISAKQLLHFIQGFYLEFSEYNEGPVKNVMTYGTDLPPKYNIRAINKPIYIYHGSNDLCADFADIGRLVQELGNNLAQIHLISDPLFDHLADYVVHERAKELVYDFILSDIRDEISN